MNIDAFPGRPKLFSMSDQRMASHLQSHDWSACHLGSPETWPESLQLLVGIMLNSQQPMFVIWGPENCLIYNDGYAEILSSKHPAACGAPFLEVWHEIRDDLIPIVEKALGGEPIFMEDIELTMERKGYPEETHFSFSYTPIRDGRGKVAGIFCPCVETTRYVLSERQLRLQDKEILEALETQKRMVEEKDLLLAEVNHRVKNSLQLVVSALSLQSRRLTDVATKEAFAQAITRVRAITSVHERLYKSGNPLVVDMKNYLQGLADDLAGTPEMRARMTVHADDFTLRTERAIPIAIIVNELVTNSLKYAYPMDRPGPIALSLIRKDDRVLELTVADEGVGMLNKEEAGGGLGSKLVATMATQLDATLVRQVTADGYSVTLAFPAEELG